MQRRDFLKSAVLTSLLPTVASGAKRLTVLVIGGTGFVGPPLVRSLTDGGHRVTLFNRGKSNTQLFPELEKLKGDRTKDLSALEGRRFDVVIDNIAFFPRAVRMMTDVLSDSGFYLLVSTISVYRDLGKASVQEDSPVSTLADPTTEDVSGGSYGGLKALCEEEVLKRMPGKSAVVRPGLIVGPGDKTDRFTYWPARVAQGGKILCPGRPEWGVQFIDVRDLAAFMTHLCQTKTTGTFNAIGNPRPMGQLLATCAQAANTEPELVWMDLAAMKQHKVRAWSDMPVFIPPHQGKEVFVSNHKARSNSLSFRPLSETVADTLKFHRTRGQNYELKAGLSLQRENEILKALGHSASQDSKEKRPS